MDDRSKDILFAVIQSYINNSTPVGSRYIFKKYPLGISSATIRNTMADLEDLGYLSQPHTSAGRVPTNMGYKFYVDEILDKSVDSDSELLDDLYENLMEEKCDLGSFLIKVTEMLACRSKYIGVTMSSSAEKSILKKIEFFPYKNNKLAVVILTEEGAIKHKVIDSEQSTSPKDLNRIASYLNAEFSGHSLTEVRKILLEDLNNNKHQRDNLISKAFNLCMDAINFGDTLYMDVCFTGMSDMLELPDFSDIRKIREMSKTMEDKQTIVKLLDKIIDSDGVHVCLDTEPLLRSNEFSIVASRFYERGRPFGILGLIGPKRMDYMSAISMVSTTANFLSKQFEKE